MLIPIPVLTVRYPPLQAATTIDGITFVIQDLKSSSKPPTNWASVFSIEIQINLFFNKTLFIKDTKVTKN